MTLIIDLEELSVQYYTLLQSMWLVDVDHVESTVPRAEVHVK